MSETPISIDPQNPSDVIASSKYDSSGKIGFVSLGCPKNSVDSERILTQLKMDGYDITNTYEDADVLVVNTCGFIDAAKQESLDAIKEAMTSNGKVIVTGCMGKGADADLIKKKKILAYCLFLALMLTKK